MGKKNRNNKRITYLDGEVNKQKPHNRVEYQEIIDNRREDVEDILFEKHKNFKKHNLMIKADDNKKDKETIGNKTFRTLKNGLFTAKNKDAYIKANKNHIKALPLNQQRNLIKQILEHL